MKSILTNKFSVVFVALSLFAISNITAQNPNRIEEAKESRCVKKTYCRLDMGDYDYRSQSSYGEFNPGDTVRTKFIVYSGQDYRLFACAHPDLGDIQFKVIEPIKETKRIITDIQKQEIVEYELNEYGDAKVDENGNMKVVRKYTKRDTIWGRETIIKEKLLFDSANNSKNALYWEQSIKKTKRLIIEVIVPEGDRSIFECLNIYVGRMQSKSKAFYGSY